MGQEVFNELKAKGEIIESSPLYDQLKPIADAITKRRSRDTTIHSSSTWCTKRNRTLSRLPAAMFMSWIRSCTS